MMLRSHLPLLIALLLATGCVSVPRTGVPTAPADLAPVLPREAPPLVMVGEPVGLQLADHALALIDHERKLKRKDCSGLIETVFSQLELPVPEADDAQGNSVAREFRGLERDGTLGVERPLPGDLAFFHDTYDRNHNGRIDDPLTHVAMVTEVDLDGTVTLVHYGSHGIATFKMNLAQLHAAHDEQGRKLNDRLRIQHRRDSPKTRYLASELFVAFGRAPERAQTVAHR